MMIPSVARHQSVLGLDVAKNSVTVHELPSGRSLTVPNQPDALAEALAPFSACTLAVCEASGGYEDVLLQVLVSLGMPVHRADAVKAKAFLRSYGRPKTDALDARGLALYAKERGPGLARWRPAEPHQATLTALVERRRDLVAIRAAEKNRRAAPRAAAVRQEIDSLIAVLDHQIRAIDTRIRTLIQATPRLARHEHVLRTVPGIGPTIAALLLAQMPELGRLSRRQAAALAGLAPHPRDSGTARAYRPTTGGRRSLRPPLFVAALAAARANSPLAHFYKRLLQAGKPKRLALVALMRKIVVIANARIKQQLT